MFFTLLEFEISKSTIITETNEMAFKKVKSCYIRLKVQHTLKLIWLVLSASKLVFWNKIKIEDFVFQFSNKNWKLKIEKKIAFFYFQFWIEIEMRKNSLLMYVPKRPYVFQFKKEKWKTDIYLFFKFRLWKPFFILDLRNI